MTASQDDSKSESESVHEADFFDNVPTKIEKIEMRKSSKAPSEWLKLLCSNWAKENPALVEGTDDKLDALKPFLNGKLSCQLLCRLSIPDPPTKHELAPQHIVDFWKGLGIESDFDRIFIVSQVERFCTFYNVRGLFMDEEFMLEPPVLPCPPIDPNAPVTPVAIGSPPFSGPIPVPPYPIGNGMESAAAAAAAYAAAAEASDKLNKRQRSLVDFTNPGGLSYVNKDNQKVPKAEQRRLTHVRKEARAKEREAENLRRAADKAAREATREERRQKKIMVRQEREKFAQRQKEAALKRAAELVRSNRVPIEITRGAAAAQAAADAAVAAAGGTTLYEPEPCKKKSRSAIVVSTAHDLHQIVTHSRNLWTKYNAIAREHNQKVNWATVAKELGIHVKVREKYARMYARAEQRGFCFVTCGHYKIKDYPHVFLEPLSNERKFMESHSEKVEIDMAEYGELPVNGGIVPYTNVLSNEELPAHPVHGEDVTPVHQVSPGPLQTAEGPIIVEEAIETSKDGTVAITEIQTDAVAVVNEVMKSGSVGNTDEAQTVAEAAAAVVVDVIHTAEHDEEVDEDEVGDQPKDHHVSETSTSPEKEVTPKAEMK